MNSQSEFIYHITTLEQWQKAMESGVYEADSLATEGFIHCSTENQVAGVLERYYKGQTGLVKLTIERSKVERPLVFELAGSINEVFPHIHGPLNLDAVIEVNPVLS
ncbi:MAG TPA: DUF952 domain-containing protein [Chitinophagaceae bacterium]|nr:DUF952 domain-containing protein [Chitinophagaceae bacterium]